MDNSALAEQVPSPEPTDPLLGRELGDFVVRERLGAGGFGAIYRAEQQALGREAAIKVMLPGSGQSPVNVQRFLREARLASTFDHPYAAHVYAFGAESDGLLWIAMEYVKGTSLEQVLKRQGPMPVARWVSLFERICEVVHAAHEQGIIHRDIKPANVMVISRAGRLLPKLLDFGIAKTRLGAAESQAEQEPALAHFPQAVPDSTVADPLIPFTVSDATTAGVLHKELVGTLIAGESSGASSETPTGEGVLPQELLTTSQPTPRLTDSADLNLTQGGQFVGSPHFMAPEQWATSQAADARMDIYALGALAYQALTGHPPFEAATMAALARAHLKSPPPELGPGFPPALSAVIQRALSKKPEARFSTANEFATAFRAAASENEDELPTLSELLRERVVSDAPQPLAEAVASLEASRTAVHALAAAGQVRRAVATLLGLMALAARARLGGSPGEDSKELVELLAELRSRGLTPARWAALAQALCHPFVARRELHPLPELVSVFFNEDGTRTRTLALLWEDPVPPGQTLTEAGARKALGAAIKQLEELLGGLGVLEAYAWVRVSDSVGERWMGVRRVRRTRQPLLARTTPQGQLALCDREGAEVLSLWPLVQLLAPSPGMPEEPFLFDGRGRHGARLSAIPGGFERQDDLIEPWLDEAGLGGSNAKDLEQRELATPYKGLSTFTPGDADNFFGRDREAEAFANRIRVQPLIAVVGPSGAGKSSFIQAGVLPSLPATWKHVVLRPGPRPLTALLDALTALGVRPSGGREELEARPERLGELLRAAGQEDGLTRVLVVDQFEELVTLCRSAQERELYARALARVGGANDPARVILTLRDDFLIRLQQLPELGERIGPGLQLLGTPAPQDLQRILTEPARRAGYTFDDPTLPKLMVESVAEQPGALALLSFTASKIWELRDRQLKVLTRKAYDSLGGVGGALAHHAETTLSAMEPAEQQLVREAFRHLVTAEGTRAVLSRAEMEQVLGGGPAALGMLERMIQARLLTAFEGVGGEERIEVIHETLLARWPRLVTWQREDAENVRVRDQLRAAARQWKDRGRPSGLLWRGEVLTEYRLWRNRYAGALTDAERDFANASLREEARGRNTRRGALAAVFVGLVVALALITRSRGQARQRLNELHQEQGRLSLQAGNVFQGLVYLGRAYSDGMEGGVIRYLVGSALRSLGGQERVYSGQGGLVTSAVVSPDGRWVASAGLNHSLRIWSPATGEEKGSVQLDSIASDLAFSTDGTRVVTADEGGHLKAWSVPDARPLGTLGTVKAGFVSAAASPDGRWFATSSDDSKCEIWDARTGALHATLPLKRNAMAFYFSPDSKTLALFPGLLDRSNTVDFDATLWDPETGALKVTLRGHKGSIRALAFSPTGDRVLTGSEDGTARLWDTATGRELWVKEASISKVMDVTFGPDGKTVATSGEDKLAHVFSAADGHRLVSLVGHTGPVRQVRYTPDGKRVLTVGDDGAGKLWDAATGAPLWTYLGHLGPILQLIPWGNNSIITTGVDGTARVWRTDIRRQQGELPPVGHDSRGIFSPDGSHILTGVEDGVLRLFNRSTGALERTFPIPFKGATDFAWSPDGAWLALNQGTKARLLHFPDLTPGPELSVQGGPILTWSFSPDSRWLVTTNDGQGLTVWDLRTARPLWTGRPITARILAARFSRDGRLLAAGDLEGNIAVMDAGTGKVRRSWHGHESVVTGLSFSPSGDALASGAYDHTVAIWDVASGARRTRLTGVRSGLDATLYTPDGQYVVGVAVSGSVRVWDATTGTEVDSFMAGTSNAGAALDPTGGSLLTVDNRSGEKTLWDIRPTRLSPKELEHVLHCQVPYGFSGEQVLPQPLKADPSCR